MAARLFPRHGLYFYRMMFARWRSGILLFLAFGACSDPGEDPHDPGIFVVAGGGGTDTVVTTFVQALVVDVVTPQGVAEGVIVRFDGTLSNGTPTVLVAPIVGQSVFVPGVAIATDARGRASVRVQLGTVAGPAEVHITVPEFGYSTTVTYTVTPGLPVALTVAPQDTVVEVGASFTSRSQVVDQFGNAVNEPVALLQPSANLSVAGTQITATAPGRGTVTARAGTFADVLRVFVGPLSGNSGLTTTALLLFETNGNVASNTSLSLAGNPFTADWSPDGQMLVADDSEVRPLRVILPDGQSRTLPVTPGDWPLYPEFSPDGQWIYYARSDAGWHIRRVHPDGTGDQVVPGIPANHAAPTLSPDGTMMAVVNLIPDRIEIYDFATGTLREIAAAAHTPAWSPDGSRIAFVNTSTDQIEIMSPDGTGRRAITSPPFRFGLGVDWTKDGLFVIGFDRNEQMIVAIDPESLATLEYRFPGIGAPAARPR